MVGQPGTFGNGSVDKEQLSGISECGSYFAEKEGIYNVGRASLLTNVLEMTMVQSTLLFDKIKKHM